MMGYQTTKNPKSPAASCAAYNMQIGSWVKIQTVLDGTMAMRAAERVYLPQHAEETDDSYQERLNRCTLFNKSDITLATWVGRPFSDPLRPDEENPVPPQIEELLDDVDLMGNDADVFCRRWFRDGMAKALSHVLVDYPRALESVDGRPRTLADDRAANSRPYWVHITPEQLFFLDAEVVGGREVLREVRFFETAREREGFAEVEHLQIRRLFLAATDVGQRVEVEVYRFNPKAKKEEEKWRLFESYPMDIDVIPLVTFYADRSGLMQGKPPLEDLVDLNIAHWQSTSDQRAVLTVARFPMLALSGGTDENNQLRVGPNEWLWSPDPQSKFYYVEHTGKAIEAGRKDLEDLELQMDAYGATFMTKKPGHPTATARALDSAEATSPLQDATYRFTDALTQVLDLTARWLRLEDGGQLSVITDFGPEEFKEGDLKGLIEARKNRDISRETFLSELQRRGVLNEELDLDEEAGRLEKEAMEMAERQAELDLDPEGGNTPPPDKDDEGGDDE